MQGRNGFTLLEILVVVLIIAVLATVVGVNVAREPGRARQAVAAAQIANLRTALQRYRMDHGMYPTQEQGLEALCRRPTRAPIPRGPYPPDGYLESSEVPLDPWGQPYIYLVPGSGNAPFEIVSYGADREPGGEGENADISSLRLGQTGAP